MSSIAVVWWSGSGNTEAMAQAIVSQIDKTGHTVESFEAVDFEESEVSRFDGFAFGCPSMGAEELETTEFEPMWDSVSDKLGEAPVLLFGSYGWGSGEWMDSWKRQCDDLNINVVDTLIINDTPDSEGLAQCERAGLTLVDSL